MEGQEPDADELPPELLDAAYLTARLLMFLWEQGKQSNRDTNLPEGETKCT